MTYSARILTGMGIMAIFGVSGAFAQVATRPADAPKDDKAEVKRTQVKTGAPTTGGVTVFVDPATRQIRQPEAGEIGTLSRPESGVKLSPEGITAAEKAATFRGPGNSVGMKVDESTFAYSVATKKADGTLDMDCITGDKAATNAVMNPVAKPAAKPVVKKEPLDVQ